MQPPEVPGELKEDAKEDKSSSELSKKSKVESTSSIPANAGN